MEIRKFIKRFLVPGVLRTFIYLLRFRAFVSPRAEVDLSPRLVLGRDVVISSFTKLKALDGPVEIGNNTSIGPGCFISSGVAGIRIGDDTMIAANTVMVANNHIYDRLDVPMRIQGNRSQGIVVENDVWIGANATLLDGAHVCSGSIVTAGSVVSGRIPPRVIVSGNPARVIFERR